MVHTVGSVQRESSGQAWIWGIASELLRTGMQPGQWQNTITSQQQLYSQTKDVFIGKI